jgi:acetyl/propionyl-CoA carboxylase alpha subunit
VPAGPGIRDDSGVTEGDEVSIYYDPMISKLAAWGRTRTEAIDRLRRALDEYAVGGIKTTLPFFRQIVRDQEFIAGRLDTGFIPRFNERCRERKHPAAGAQASPLQTDIAIIAAAVAYAQTQRQLTNHQPQQASKWKTTGRELTLNRTPRNPTAQFNE